MTPACRKTAAPRDRRFRPPHCANADCPYSVPRPDWHFVRNGYYRRPSDRRIFPLFLCRHCGTSFSSRTFSTTYRLRRRRHFRLIAAWACEGPGLRQTGRVLGISHSTVARHLARLGRHCLLFHLKLFADRPDFRLLEATVLDGFETFAYSQYYPFHANLAAGARSTFIYGFNHALLRRKGRMTEHQKRRRAELEARLGRPDPKAIQRAVADLVRELTTRLPTGATLCLHTDDHPAYRRALHDLRREAACPPIRHLITSSKQRRTTSNPLFPVNLADLRLRHGQANHRRETIAFSKRLQAALERLAAFVLWSNCIKRKSEKEDETTAAMEAGLLERPLSWSEILRRRLFPKHWPLSAQWREYYERRVTTPPLEGREAVHACTYAY